MKPMIKLALPLLLAAASVSHAETRQGADLSRLQIGGGLSYNIIDSPFGHGSSDASGILLFGGYRLDSAWPGITSSVELGYNRTSRFDEYHENISGPWIALVGERGLPEVDRRLSLLGRVGLDVGDDDGILMGVGVGFRVDPRIQLRAEYINRDASTQTLASLMIDL